MNLLSAVNSCLLLFLPVFAMAQDTSVAKKDTTAAGVVAAGVAATQVSDSPGKKTDTAGTTATTNCYKDWYDAFTMRGAKPVTDGMQDVVITFKNGESCHCFMGRVEVVGGKIKTPLQVQTENGDYKTFASMGKKLDPDFVAAQGDQLWKIADGMSVVFKTSDNEYGRLFFYKFVNKGNQTNKSAPSPAELLNQ